MRSLKKNMQKLYYSTYEKEVEVYKTDENGDIVYVNVDGEDVPVVTGTKPLYNKPVLFYANISAGKGSAQDSPFGSDVDYTRTISTSDMKCPINELTLLWLEGKPRYNTDGSVDADSSDYKVAAYPAKSLNNIVIAIKKLPAG